MLVITFLLFFSWLSFIWQSPLESIASSSPSSRKVVKMASKIGGTVRTEWTGIPGLVHPVAPHRTSHIICWSRLSRKLDHHKSHLIQTSLFHSVLLHQLMALCLQEWQYSLLSRRSWFYSCDSSHSNEQQQHYWTLLLSLSPITLYSTDCHILMLIKSHCCCVDTPWFYLMPALVSSSSCAHLLVSASSSSFCCSVVRDSCVPSRIDDDGWWWQ